MTPLASSRRAERIPPLFVAGGIPERRRHLAPPSAAAEVRRRSPTVRPTRGEHS
jgi:hypothetical protein